MIVSEIYKLLNDADKSTFPDQCINGSDQPNIHVHRSLIEIRPHINNGMLHTKNTYIIASLSHMQEPYNQPWSMVLSL